MAERHYPSFSDATKCACGLPMGHSAAKATNRPLEDEKLSKLQTEWYRLERLVYDCQESQRKICEELLTRVEDAQNRES